MAVQYQGSLGALRETMREGRQKELELQNMERACTALRNKRARVTMVTAPSLTLLEAAQAADEPVRHSVNVKLADASDAD